MRVFEYPAKPLWLRRRHMEAAVSTSNTPKRSDFEDPTLTQLAVEELGIPLEHWRRCHRKWWEWVRVLSASQTQTALSANSRVLGIASGHETPLYWFCNHVRLVVATDLYGMGAFRDFEADGKMMVDPSCYSPIEYDRSALLVERADARSLPFASESFDFAFSCSSVEHFGDDADTVRAMREAFRVLRPGAIYALAVDYLWDQGSRKHRGRARRKGVLGEFLTADEVMTLLVERPGFELAEPVVFDVEDDTPPVALDGPDPNSVYPHLQLSIGGMRFTSLFLALRKPRSAALPRIAKCSNLLGR